MVAIPILFPLVKPFRASWSGKRFSCSPSLRTPGRIRQVWGQRTFWNTQFGTNCGRLPKSPPSESVSGTWCFSRPQYLCTYKTDLAKMLQRFSKISRLWLQGKRLALTGCLKHVPQKVHVTQHSDRLEDAHFQKPLPLWEPTKWSLAGSLYGNGLESSSCCKNHSAELCLVS